MEENTIMYSQKKEEAILILKSFIPKNNKDVINIIETVLGCYAEPEVVNENGIKVQEPTNQSNEVKFLIDELKSFIDGIKK